MPVENVPFGADVRPSGREEMPTAKVFVGGRNRSEEIT